MAMDLAWENVPVHSSLVAKKDFRDSWKGSVSVKCIEMLMF